MMADVHADPDAAGGALGRAELERKLQIRRGQSVAVLKPPVESKLRLMAAGRADPDRADVVIGFALRSVDLARLKPAYTAARAGRLAWIGYPKPGTPGADLRREWLLRALRQYGIAAVQDVSIDGAWSALQLGPIADAGRHEMTAAGGDGR